MSFRSARTAEGGCSHTTYLCSLILTRISTASSLTSDREQVIARAREAGVRTIVAIGNGDGPAQVDCGIRLAEKYDFIYATLGIHPHEARLADEGGISEDGSGWRSIRR